MAVRPMMLFVCEMNTTTKVNVKTTAYLLLGLWLSIRLIVRDRGVVSVQPIPSFLDFKNGRRHS